MTDDRINGPGLWHATVNDLPHSYIVEAPNAEAGSIAAATAAGIDGGDDDVVVLRWLGPIGSVTVLQVGEKQPERRDDRRAFKLVTEGGPARAH